MFTKDEVTSIKETRGRYYQQGLYLGEIFDSHLIDRMTEDLDFKTTLTFAVADTEYYITLLETASMQAKISGGGHCVN